MSDPEESLRAGAHEPSKTYLKSFEISGLFGGPPIEIKFPNPTAAIDSPAAVILSGRNGVGKTTILRMIGGMLTLNFYEFRKMPFAKARLLLSSGDELTAEKTNNRLRPLRVSFNEQVCELASDRNEAKYEDEELARISRFRDRGLNLLRGIQYQLVELDRVSKLGERKQIADQRGRIITRVRTH